MNPVTNFEKWINSIATGTAPDIPPVTRFEHFLNKIRLAIARKSDITSGLPDVTAEDNDKVLTVVEGAWDKAVPSGGGGDVEVVTFTVGQDMSITSDKTHAEVEQMVADGKTILGRLNEGNGTGYMQSAINGNFEFVFMVASSGSTPSLAVAHVTYTSEQLLFSMFNVEGSN